MRDGPFLGDRSGNGGVDAHSIGNVVDTGDVSASTVAAQQVYISPAARLSLPVIKSIRVSNTSHIPDLIILTAIKRQNRRGQPV